MWFYLIITIDRVISNKTPGYREWPFRLFNVTSPVSIFDATFREYIFLYLNTSVFYPLEEVIIRISQHSPCCRHSQVHWRCCLRRNEFCGNAKRRGMCKANNFFGHKFRIGFDWFSGRPTKSVVESPRPSLTTITICSRNIRPPYRRQSSLN